MRGQRRRASVAPRGLANLSAHGPARTTALAYPSLLEPRGNLTASGGQCPGEFPMICQVHHTTTYTYPGTVSVCHNAVYLRPRDSAQQCCLSYELVVLPEPGVCSQYVDFFGNAVTFFAVQEPYRTLTVTAKSTVEVTPRVVPYADDTPAWETVRHILHHEWSAAVLEAAPYLFDSPHITWSPRLR